MIESMAGAIDFSSIVGEGTTFNIYSAREIGINILFVKSIYSKRFYL